MSAAFRLIAHRGASAHAPENTVAAFETAVALGSEEVELDVRFSGDGEVVVFHDHELQRKTALSGPVRHYPAEVLEQVDLGPWFGGHTSTVNDFAQFGERATCIPRHLTSRSVGLCCQGRGIPSGPRCSSTAVLTRRDEHPLATGRYESSTCPVHGVH